MAASGSYTEQLVAMSQGDPGQRYNRVPGVVLGEGSFGKVFQAVDKVTGKEVAIKKMVYNPAHLKVMLTEVRHLKMCGEHRNITQFHGLYHKPSFLLVVMELIDGLNGYELALHTPVKPSQLAFIAREMMQGLDHIHKLQLLHHDIKMQNVMLSRGGQVKIADFGLSVKATDKKVLVGTPRYWAPEVVRSRDYTTTIDVWAAGITIYAMAERELPYPEVKECNIERVIWYNKITPRLSSPHPVAMQQFVAECLQEQESRPQAAQMLRHKWLNSACQRSEFADFVTVVKKEIEMQK